MHRRARKRGKDKHLARVDRPSAESRTRQLRQGTRVGIAAGLLCVLTLIGYTNGLSNGFVWDDSVQIVMNPDLRPGAPWIRLFTSDVWAHAHRDQRVQTNYYRPLQMATYRLMSDLFGLDSQRLHILSLVLALAAGPRGLHGIFEID